MRLFTYAASGNAHKVRLLLALLGRDDVERVEVDLFAGGTLTEAFGRLNPLREVPVLELDDGTALGQSPAILWFLAEGTPFLPGDRVGRARVLQWLVFEQERVMPGIGGTRFHRLTGRAALDPGPVAARAAKGEHALDVLDAHLAGRAWVAGDGPTIADVALHGYVHVAPEGGFDLAARPGVLAWLERLTALPGYAEDLVPYGANARPGAGRSIYD
jgi:glutathione S-transferase